MTERASWATMDGTARIVDVEDARLAMGALWTPGWNGINARRGIRAAPGDPGKVSASTGTSDQNVHVAAFQVVLPALRGDGSYTATLSTDKTIDVLTTYPADAANGRRDLIVAVQTDTFYNDDSTVFEVKHIVGTPAATPADPAIGYSDFLMLARVHVGPNATAITASDIDDLRPGWTVANGGILPVGSVSARDELVPYVGMGVYRTDKNFVEFWTGSTWQPRGAVVVDDLGDVTDPITGQMAMLSTDGVLYRWNGNAWSEYRGKAQPRGVIARYKRTTNPPPTSATTTAAAVKVAELTVALTAGRLYLIRIPQVALFSATAASSRAQAILTYTTDGSAPSGSSTCVATGQVMLPPSGVVIATNVEGTYTPSTSQTLRVLCSYLCDGNTAQMYCTGDGWPFEMYVEDLGYDPGASGTSY